MPQSQDKNLRLTSVNYNQIDRISLSDTIVLEAIFPLNEDVEFQVAFHDPHFYWHTYNGLTIPKATFNIKAGGDYYLSVHATRYERLNRREDRCQEEKDYSFTACVRVRDRDHHQEKCLVSVDWSEPDTRVSDPLGHLE